MDSVNEDSSVPEELETCCTGSAKTSKSTSKTKRKKSKKRKKGRRKKVTLYNTIPHLRYNRHCLQGGGEKCSIMYRESIGVIDSTHTPIDTLIYIPLQMRLSLMNMLCSHLTTSGQCHYLPH